MAFLDETGLARVWNKIKALIPTKTSDLTNDSGFLTQHQSLSGYATEQWVENKGYLTQHQSLVEYRKSADQDLIDSGKQEKLVSGTNIKTINNQSILGSGNINVSGGGGISYESGSSGNWTWKKYSDGTFEAYYKRTGVTLNITGSSGNGWYRSNVYNVSLPSIGITEVLSIVPTIVANYAYIQQNVTVVSTSQISYYVTHLGTLSNISADYYWQICGTWS